MHTQVSDRDGVVLAPGDILGFRRTSRTMAGYHSNPYNLPCTAIRQVEEMRGPELMPC